MRSIFLCESGKNLKWVFSEEAISYIVENLDGDSTIYDKESVLSNKGKFNEVRFIFSTWIIAKFSEKEIKEYFPKLECIFYAAGTVKDFAIPFLNCGVRIFSAWMANAIPVAEFVTAQIVLANVGYFSVSKAYSAGEVDEAKNRFANYNGNYGNTIGIIGAGTIGKIVITMLKAYNLDIVVFDPFLSDESAKELGVKKVSLEQLFLESNVISNHLADNDATKNILNKQLFEIMQPYATFINTGRGAQVVEEDLIEILKNREDITALLDVTVSEPPEKESEFYCLENCILTPHIAGSSGNEVHRLAQYAIDECERYLKGEESKAEIKKEMLEIMA